MISAILFISFFIFLILGLPIAICLGLSSVCAILYSGTSLTIVAFCPETSWQKPVFPND